MSLWLVRAGGSGEYESKFLSEGRIYLTWRGLSNDLSKLETKQDLYDLLVSVHPDDKPGRIRNWTGQIWPIAKEMKPGDWVVLPSKKKASIHIGEITGDYVNDPSAEDPFYHNRTINWFAADIPRSNFDQDILYSFGAFMTICRISRNNAEERVRGMAKNEWKSQLPPPSLETTDTAQAESTGYYDIERVARDQIAKYLTSKFKGHGMARLVEAILKAQGYGVNRGNRGRAKLLH